MFRNIGNRMPIPTTPSHQVKPLQPAINGITSGFRVKGTKNRSI